MNFDLLLKGKTIAILIKDEYDDKFLPLTECLISPFQTGEHMHALELIAWICCPPVQKSKAIEISMLQIKCIKMC